jgi:fucose 4-O-acetylase-like acetyltransferase
MITEELAVMCFIVVYVLTSYSVAKGCKPCERVIQHLFNSTNYAHPLQLLLSATVSTAKTAQHAFNIEMSRMR